MASCRQNLRSPLLSSGASNLARSCTASSFSDAAFSTANSLTDSFANPHVRAVPSLLPFNHKYLPTMLSFRAGLTVPPRRTSSFRIAKSSALQSFILSSLALPQRSLHLHPPSFFLPAFLSCSLQLLFFIPLRPPLILLPNNGCSLICLVANLLEKTD